jgi:hypothetical protein
MARGATLVVALVEAGTVDLVLLVRVLEMDPSSTIAWISCGHVV